MSDKKPLHASKPKIEVWPNSPPIANNAKKDRPSTLMSLDANKLGTVSEYGTFTPLPSTPPAAAVVGGGNSNASNPDRRGSETSHIRGKNRVFEVTPAVVGAYDNPCYVSDNQGNRSSQSQTREEEQRVIIPNGFSHKKPRKASLAFPAYLRRISTETPPAIVNEPSTESPNRLQPYNTFNYETIPRMENYQKKIRMERKISKEKAKLGIASDAPDEKVGIY